MHILVLGGTGAMGIPLVKLLSKENIVYVTSRKPHESTGSVKYLRGDAKKKDFLVSVLSIHRWDAVVDFMVRSEKELKACLPLFLESTEQYVFISSARVYAESGVPITEQSPRLLEVSKDAEYLKTNEYALAKAREEDLLIHSGKQNYTIIRPSITYNTHRLQLGVLEKENWLYRALRGRSIVFSNDVGDKLTTMTSGNDVAKGIASVIGKRAALGEVFHITCHQKSLPWSEVLAIYLEVLERHLGTRKIPVIMTDKSTNLLFPHKIHQLIYCRYFNRTFDNSKIARFCDVETFTMPEQGLSSCLSQFLENPTFSSIDWRIEAVNDRVAGERTPLGEIPTIGRKIFYLAYRYDFVLIQKMLDLLWRVSKKIKHIL